MIKKIYFILSLISINLNTLCSETTEIDTKINSELQKYIEQTLHGTTQEKIIYSLFLIDAGSDILNTDKYKKYSDPNLFTEKKELKEFYCELIQCIIEISKTINSTDPKKAFDELNEIAQEKCNIM